MHCLPGYARAHPNAFGAALAIDAHENEPKSLRFFPPWICLASQTGRTRVRKKHCLIRSELAERYGEEFRADRFYRRTFLDIVLEQFVEGFRVRNLLR